MLIDMHIHTNASDGVYTIDDVINEAIKRNVGYFSISDHDSIDNSKQVLGILKERNITNLKFVPGVEITTTYKGREMHILFYSYDIDIDEVHKFCAAAIAERTRATEAFIAEIENEYKGIVNLEEYVNYKYDIKQGGFKLINYLMEKGVVTRENFFFPEWRNRWDTQVFIQSEEVIRTLKAKNGKIVLAHPSYYYRDGVMPKEDLDNFKEYGIDGIECYSPYCKKDYYDYYVEYCKANNLLVTVGSDSHGAFTKEREIGKPNVNINNENIKRTIDIIYNEEKNRN